jgi:predicted DNA-binding transcriptional regulator AlpA
LSTAVASDGAGSIQREPVPPAADLEPDLAALFAQPTRLATLLRALADHVDPSRMPGGRREPEECYIDLRALVAYSGRSRKWIQRRIKYAALPVYCPNGKLMFKKSEFDSWLLAYRKTGNPALQTIVNEVVASLHRAAT